MISAALVAAIVILAIGLGRCIWPTHLRMPVIPQQPDRSTGRWLRECEQILAAGTGRHRAPTRLGGWPR